MGFVLPFVERDLLFMRHAHSIAISGHKFLGVPFPCGVFLLKEQRFLNLIRNPVEYIGSNDVTITGSRNGHAVLFLRHVLRTVVAAEGFIRSVEACFECAEYLVDQIESRLPHYNPWRNQNSITVVIKRPPRQIIEKWQLATQDTVSHIVCMPQVTRERIDHFIADLLAAVEDVGNCGYNNGSVVLLQPIAINNDCTK
jgi:histidine decarboxylase